MSFPEKLTEQLEDLVKNSRSKDLIASSKRVSERYRNQDWKLTSSEKLCYAAFRMPATFAVISHLTKDLCFTTVLDVGAGPGTAGFALHGEITALERDRDFIALGKTLGAPVNWEEGDLRSWSPKKMYDLILFSYSYGEVDKVDLAPYWNHCSRQLLIIEPGTPSGWKNILRAREELIGLGGQIWAPCPHHVACPLADPDWCHFGLKLERSPLHRRLKEGTLSYEEEKFSYLLVGREEKRCNSRILRAPQKRTGHIHLKLCTEEGLEERIVSKREGSLFRAVKKAEWGDII